MVSFQSDLLLTINESHEKYLSKMTKLFTNDNIVNNLSIEEAEKLIEYIKEYKKLINSTCLLIDNINNIKNESKINKKIEEELMLKMIPIMNVYRTLLYEKYSVKSSFSQNEITQNNYKIKNDISKSDISKSDITDID